MRTVRSSFYQNPDRTFPGPAAHNSGAMSENLTDSVVDLRLGELAARSGGVESESPSESFLDFSQAFSDLSGCSSDISGELHRLASTQSFNPDPDPDSEEPEPCPGFLERETFSTEIIESISPEDLQPTVKLCVDSLQSPSIAVKRSAAAKLRLLAKNRADNRALIGESGAVPALIDLLRCTDPWAQEHAVTALLNLSLHDDNKKLMSGPVAIKALIYVLKSGRESSKQNAACALLNLSLVGEEVKMSIGACGAIPPLVSLLIHGSTRGKKDALTTLYKAIAREGGIGALVEALEEASSEKGKEFAVMTLLQLCGESVRNRGLLVREGGIPPLAALSQSGTLKAKHKAETLLRYLREPRQEASTSTSP